MFWVHCGLFVLVIAVPGFISSADSTSKREADYTLDDSFWNEETPVGEVERLLREYRQNQELVRNIGSHYYQIIYPVQLRHHEKMGISTREAGFPKYPQRSGYGDGGYQNARGRSRAGKHFHRTSLLIKAFNHKFRLDLELNTQLLAPNLNQKDYLAKDAEQVTKQEIEHCYYHGTVRDYPGATAAFHTCNGVSGVIHLGNETFVIQPFYGGDLSRHPHVIFEARTKADKGCANSGSTEHRMVKNRRQKHVLGLSESTAERYKRDVREATKYIETAIVIDKAMFDKRNGSTRAEVVHDAIQVANIADLYFRTLNTRVSVVYVETWLGGNQAKLDPNMDIKRALLDFNDYTKRVMYQVTADTTQLLTGETFKDGESGIATEETVCTTASVGVSVDLNTYEPHLLAGTMAHMIGHNIGMGHDDGRQGCFCHDWHGCIMAKSIVGLENVQPYKFSECSKTDYEGALKAGKGICLFNKPNELKLRSCGNRVIDDGEQCDCGTIDECPDLDPCCDPITCKLKSESECASGPCCTNCKLRERGYVCRQSSNECDLPEVCSGETGQCPADVYKKNGTPCSKDASYCFNGVCPSLDLQCEQVWGEGGIAADKQCFEQFNPKGSINGHCGTDNSGHYVKCEAENVRCGSLQCQSGKKQPVIGRMDQPYLRTFIFIKGKEYECKSTTGKVEGSEMPGMGLVRDGTSCGDNLVCYNQTCTSLFPHIDPGKCPSNLNNKECSGHGVCTNMNKCYCYPGWSGPDCSIEQDIPTLKPTTSTTEKPGKSTTETKLQKKETPYENYHGSNTVFLVGMLMSVVGGVFVVFALMALCYRRKSTVQKYDPPYSKKPTPKPYSSTSGNHHPEVAALDNVNKILTFGSMPTYSCGDSQRVVYQTQNNVSNVDGARHKDHKPPMKRLGVDDEDGGTGAEEVVSFIDLPPNSLAKLPEKGILKKHGGYGIVDGTMMERTLSSLNAVNGYHGDVVEALRNAASLRGMASTPSGSRTLLDDEALRKSLADCGYADAYRKVQQQQQQAQQQQQQQDDQDNIDNQDDENEDDLPPSCGPIRIRTLEDIIRQLEHHSTRHMSPSGSEDMRISEGEGDRHYRIDSSVCSESSQGSRRCGRDDDRFVYGRYRQPSARSPYGTHQHTHQHSHQMHEEEGIYETADPDRGSNTRGETPDSESDAFIQAQHQIARWTSEAGGGGGGLGGGSSTSIGGGVQHRPPQQPPPPPLQLPTSGGAAAPSASSAAAAAATVLATMGHQVIHQLQLRQRQQQQKQQQRKLPAEQLPIKERGYYPSPPHTDNGLDDDDDDDNDDNYGTYGDDDDRDDNDNDDDDDDNDNLDYDEKIHEAVNAQSHQDIKILNNNDKRNARKRIKSLLRNPESAEDKTMTIREIDVNHLPNINKRPLDDKYSLECKIIMNNGGKNSSTIATTTNKCDDEVYDDDDLSKNNTSNNTSDNENTALLPPSHFPEYKH